MRRPARFRLLLLAALAACLAPIAGCATEHPPALTGSALSEARTFPYYRLYWVGPSFAGKPLAAVDGLRNYSSGIGDSLYYGDCVSGKGLLGGGGSCLLPLQVTTVIYRLHSNAPLGAQRNIVVRGVPATIYNEERSVEIYTGRLTIDVLSDSLANALRAANLLLPINAPGSSGAPLEPPVYCPGLSGPIPAHVRQVMAHLPGHPCQKSAAALVASEQLAESGASSR
jgi:hypothetical protein